MARFPPSADLKLAPPLGAGDLPAYRYVPGRTPHPFRDPRGHSYRGGQPPEPAALGQGPLGEHPAFLRGLGLMEAGYHWEAHEIWEGLWHQLPRQSRQAALLQGLIQLAAARLKHEMGHHRAARSLMQAAAPRLRQDHPELEAELLWQQGWAEISAGG